MDFYIYSPDGRQTGPHTADYLRNRLATGGLTGACTFAVVEDGAEPRQGDFRPVSASNVARFTGGPLTAATPLNGSGPGGVLRFGGIALAALGVVGALVGALTPGASPYGASELSFALFVAAAVQALVYGGLLWAAGTAVGLLDRIARRPTA